MKVFIGDVLIRGEWVCADLVKVGLDDDPKPWRVEAPGEDYDGWLMSDAEVAGVLEEKG